MSKTQVKTQGKRPVGKGLAIKISNKLKSKGKLHKKKPPVKSFSDKDRKKNQRPDRSPANERKCHPAKNSKSIPKKRRTASSGEESSDEEEDLQSFEKRTRLQFRVVAHEESVSGDAGADDSVHEQMDTSSLKPEASVQSPKADVPEAMSLIEVIGAKRQMVREQKQMVGNVCVAVVSFPEKNIRRLKPIIAMLDYRNDDVVFKVSFLKQQTLIAYSLLEVFRDILPAYTIRETAEEDVLNKKLKKETRELREYESCLLKYYRMYISKLQRMTECIKKRKQSNFYDQALTTFDAKEKIAVVGTRCLSCLMLTHSNFNFGQILIETVVPLMSSRVQSVRELAFENVTRLFREDRTGQASLLAVKSAGKVIRAYKMNVHPLIIQSFVCLKIKEVTRKDESVDMKAVREKMRKQSKMERKHNKELLKLKGELREADARVDQEKKLAAHTQILNQIFFVYFRFIRDFIQLADSDFSKNAAVVTPVMEGLSKFAHLLNIDFLPDLVSLLHRLVVSQRLSDMQILHCIHTVFTILSGEGSAVTVDPQRFYARLYSCLTNFDIESDGEDFVQILMQSFDKMLSRRKKQLTMARVLAFCKRFSSVALHSSPEVAALYLSFLRLLLQDHPKADLLMDSEHCGSGSFDPQLADPEFCNANATRLWELHLLHRHVDPTVSRSAAHHLQRMQNHKVKSDLLLRSPDQVYSDSCSRNKMKNLLTGKCPTGSTSAKRKGNTRLETHGLKESDVRLWQSLTFQRQ